MKVGDIVAIINTNETFVTMLSEFKCYDGRRVDKDAMKRHNEIHKKYLNWLESEIPNEQ